MSDQPGGSVTVFVTGLAGPSSQTGLAAADQARPMIRVTQVKNDLAFINKFGLTIELSPQQRQPCGTKTEQGERGRLRHRCNLAANLAVGERRRVEVDIP